jgi:inhibitor of KinA
MNILPLGDHAVMVEYPQQIDPHIHRQVMHLFHYIKALELPDITDLIPAYASLTIVYAPGFSGVESLIASAPPLTDPVYIPRLLEIPVCYDLSMAPDLQHMADQKGLSVEEIVRLHTSIDYTVYMLGFLPGFPYMGKVDDRIATSRLKKPRTEVPAGSVGIAGSQTGIYPMASPGGWNIIGRTPIRMFDAGKDEPCFCNPGDQVRFIAISREAFTSYI